MRAILDAEVCQLEITNNCMNQCSNCTRLCGHHAKPYYMDFEVFKNAVDSMDGYPKHVGMMGGEPLLHPEFEKFCEYFRTKVPKERAGLWTCLPKGKEHYRESIVNTFGHIFINDHTRNDILHAPVLVASEEVDLQGWLKDYLINKCWVQNTWSPCVNTKGAWFCEVAGALAELLDENELGWKVEPYWWTRSPQHFLKQMKMCHYCGCAMPLKKRCSTDIVDDISPKMFDKIKATSPKIKKKKYVLHDGSVYEDKGQVATYKDQSYRDAIAKRYGMFLVLNEQGYLTPHLLRNWKKEN